MTNYRKPDVEYRQEIIATGVSIYLPPLPACIVGPVYDMIEDVDLGVFAGVETDYIFGTPYSVDIRAADLMTDELAYPLTITLEDAIATFGAYSLGAVALSNPYVFNADTGSNPFDFTMVDGYRYYVHMSTANTQHLLPDNGIVTNVGGTVYQIEWTTPQVFAEDLGRVINFVDSAAAAQGPFVVTTISANGLILEFDDGGIGVALGASTSVIITNTAGVLVASEMAGKRIRSINNADQCVLFSGQQSTNYTAVVYEVKRTGDIVLDVDDFSDLGISVIETGFTLPLGLQDKDGNTIDSCTKVLYTARALRIDLFETLAYYNDTSLAAAFTVNKYNTGVWGVSLALLNSVGREVYLSGLDERTYDDVERVQSYTEALSYLADYRIYGVTPMTMSLSVASVLDNHVTAQSDEFHNMFRIGFAARELVTYSEIHAGTTGDAPVGTDTEGVTGSKIVDAAGTFLTLGVKINDVVKIVDWSSIIATPYMDTGILGAPAAVTVDSGAWGDVNVRLRITGYTVPTPADMIGRTFKFLATTVSDLETAAETGLFTDESRDGAVVSTNQSYADLGYRIVDFSTDAGDTLVTLDTRNTSLTPTLPNGTTRFIVYDGPLTLTQETTLMSKDHLVFAVASEQVITSVILADWTGIYSDLEYEVRRPFSKVEQAQYIGAYAGGFANRRMNFMWPDKYEDEVADVMWGYFIAAAEAGWIAGNPPQQSITNSTLKGFHRLLHSQNSDTNYFKNTDFNEMIDAGGVTIYTQEVDGGTIKCRHQLTSDTTGILYQENSITRAADTAAYITVDMLKPLIGHWNITPELFTEVKFKLSGIDKLMTDDTKKPRIGATLKEYKTNYVVEDMTSPDTLIIDQDYTTNKPCNRIKVRARIS